MRRIGVMQEFTGAEKRRLRGERLGRDLTRIQAERALAIAVIRRDAALAWLDRYYAQSLLALLQNQVAETRLQIEGAEIAFRSGRGAPSDAFAARAALASLQDRLRLAERQAQNAVLMLARWIGADAASRPLAGPVNWRENAAAEAASAAGHAEHPQLKVLEAQALAADTELRQAQAEIRPDWTFEAAFQQRGPQFSNMASIGVSIPLQWERGSRQDRVTAARLESVTQARARLEDAEQAHDAELDVAYNDWNSGRERIARLNAELLPAAAQRTQASLIDYRSGKGNLPAVLSARREEIEARIQLLALEQETARQWVLLDYLMTSVPETQP
jgi:outer membrane protein TolC